MNNTDMGKRGGAAVRVAPGASDKCTHGAYLGSYECAECVGPLSDAELALIRRRLAGHEGCLPRCDRAPSAETARLLATIDALRDASEEDGERDPLRKLTTIEVLRDENSALRSENAALRTDVNEVRLYTGAVADEKTVVAVARTMVFVAEDAGKANAEGLYEGAKSMRDACAVAIATAIESLPLPPK